MKLAGKYAVVLVTAPDVKTARKLARAALAARLIACANLIPQVESHYRWQGKIERGAEVLLVLKTTTARLAALEQLIVAGTRTTRRSFSSCPSPAGTSATWIGWNNPCRDTHNRLRRRRGWGRFRRD